METCFKLEQGLGKYNYLLYRKPGNLQAEPLRLRWVTIQASTVLHGAMQAKPQRPAMSRYFRVNETLLFIHRFFFLLVLCLLSCLRAECCLVFRHLDLKVARLRFTALASCPKLCKGSLAVVHKTPVSCIAGKLNCFPEISS